MDKKLYRSTNDRVFSWPAAVLENFFGINPLAFRIFFSSQGLDF